MTATKTKSTKIAYISLVPHSHLSEMLEAGWAFYRSNIGGASRQSRNGAKSHAEPAERHAPDTLKKEGFYEFVIQPVVLVAWPERENFATMLLVNPHEHWERVYATKMEDELSWTQARPSVSLDLIREVCPRGRVIDVGGGSSGLAGLLLDAGYSVAVLDISQVVLSQAQASFGDRAREVQWIVADVTEAPDLGRFDVWHDRALFHFLTEASDRVRYIELLSSTVPEGGHAVIATFAEDGPEQCSGLRVCRYSGQQLADELGEGFELVKTVPETHLTPSGKTQPFQYSLFSRGLARARKESTG